MRARCLACAGFVTLRWLEELSEGVQRGLVRLEVVRADAVHFASLEVWYDDVVKVGGVEVAKGERAGIQFANRGWVSFDINFTVAAECK